MDNLHNPEDKLRLIHNVIAEYIHNPDKTAVDSMEEIIDIHLKNLSDIKML